MLLCCFVALCDTGIVSNKYLFPLKIKGCIGMFDFLLSGDYIVMKTQMCSYNEMFFGGKSNRHWHWDSVKKIVTVAIYIFRFEQMRSLQTVVIKAWLASTISSFGLFISLSALMVTIPVTTAAFEMR